MLRVLNEQNVGEMFFLDFMLFSEGCIVKWISTVMFPMLHFETFALKSLW